MHRAILATGLVVSLAPAALAQPGVHESVVYRSGTDGYHTYRIPGLVLTKKGTLLAFIEGRKTSRSDAGDIDMLPKRSLDGGETWSDQRLVSHRDSRGGPSLATSATGNFPLDFQNIQSIATTRLNRYPERAGCSRFSWFPG
jgi:sialidase-1